MNLVIGNTAQISHYFPKDYEQISSRGINYDLYKDKFYDRIFLCFAEQRTYLGYSDLFYGINVDYTLEVLDYFKEKCNNMVVYGTAELWNGYNTSVDIDMPFNYGYSDYIYSKERLIHIIKKLFQNVIIIHPFNYNTIYRKGDYLFGKIFQAIINETPLSIGNTYFYRDIIRPEYVVERSILATEDELVGSGRLTFVNDFIRDLYKSFNLDYDKLVTEDLSGPIKNSYFMKSKHCLYTYDLLFEKTFNELNDIKSKLNNMNENSINS